MHVLYIFIVCYAPSTLDLASRLYNSLPNKTFIAFSTWLQYECYVVILIIMKSQEYATFELYGSKHCGFASMDGVMFASCWVVSPHSHEAATCYN